MATKPETTRLIDEAAALIAKRAPMVDAGIYFEVIAKQPGHEAWLCGICGTNVITTPCPEHNKNGNRDLTGSHNYYEVWKKGNGKLAGTVGGRCGICDWGTWNAPCPQHGRAPK